MLPTTCIVEKDSEAEISKISPCFLGCRSPQDLIVECTYTSIPWRIVTYALG